MNTIDLKKEIKKKLRDQKDKEYWDYKENKRLITYHWTDILKNKLKSDVKPYEAANMMVMLKMLRTTRKYKADTYLDASIYLDMAKDLHKED